ncbi:GNAT family protein [Xylanimonas ulmi]
MRDGVTVGCVAHDAQESVTVRPLRWGDADVMAAWAGDVDFCDEAEWSRDLSFADHQRFHRSIVTSPPAELTRLAAVQAGVLVGYVDLHGGEPRRRELGFLIGERRRWGQGCGLRAARAGLAHGFDVLGLEQIWAEALDANQRSVRILQRLGMVETGTGDVGVFLGAATHYRQFAITATQWRTVSTSSPGLSRPTRGD